MVLPPRRKGRVKTLWVYRKPDGEILEICTRARSKRRATSPCLVTILSVFMPRPADAACRNLAAEWRREKQAEETASGRHRRRIPPNAVTLSFHSFISCVSALRATEINRNDSAVA